MSDILIKDMELPQEKKITLTIFPDGRVYENHGERLWGHGKDCIPWKAVPVPPHERLIDADALMKELEIDDLDDKTGATLLMAVFLEVLKAAPTIIEADRLPVLHGAVAAASEQEALKRIVPAKEV